MAAGASGKRSANLRGMSRTAFSLFLLASSVAAIPSSVSAQSEQAPPPEIDSIPVDQQVPDDEIRKRIASLLEKTGVAIRAQIEVSDGVVVLSGPAKSIEGSERAAAIAKAVEGVVTVQNNLEVEGGVDLGESAEVVRRSLSSLWNDFLSRLPLFIAAVVVLLLTWAAAMLARWLARRTLENRRRIRSSFKDLVVQLLSIAVWIIGLLTAAVIVFPGMTPAKVLTVLGLSSVAIGFAFKDIFENFFAGILILWRYPLDKGDFISVEGKTGKVEDITVRNTMLRQADGQLLVLPNSLLFKNPVDVITSRSTRRQTVICGVAYGEDVDRSREVIREAVDSCKSVSGAGDVQIFAREFADSSINFEITWWTGSTLLEERESRDEVVAAVKRALDNAGIEIPFPYRTLTFKEPLPLERGETGGAA